MHDNPHHCNQNNDNGAHESYLDTLGHIRERLQMLNARLPKNQTNTEGPFLTSPYASPTLGAEKGMSREDLALLSRGQIAATHSFAFRASLQAFAQHWDTMTYAQRSKHVGEYVANHYNGNEHIDAIRTFLMHETIHKPNGGKLVTWNGYFIEHVPDIQVHTKPTTGEVIVRFCKFSQKTSDCSHSDIPKLISVVDSSYDENSISTGNKKSLSKSRGNPKLVAKKNITRVASGSNLNGASFSALRNRLKREKQSFYAHDNHHSG